MGAAAEDCMEQDPAPSDDDIRRWHLLGFSCHTLADDQHTLPHAVAAITRMELAMRRKHGVELKRFLWQCWEPEVRERFQREFLQKFGAVFLCARLRARLRNDNSGDDDPSMSAGGEESALELGDAMGPDLSEKESEPALDPQQVPSIRFEGGTCTMRMSAWRLRTPGMIARDPRKMHRRPDGSSSGMMKGPGWRDPFCVSCWQALSWRGWNGWGFTPETGRHSLQPLCAASEVYTLSWDSSSWLGNFMATPERSCRETTTCWQSVSGGPCLTSMSATCDRCGIFHITASWTGIRSREFWRRSTWSNSQSKASPDSRPGGWSQCLRTVRSISFDSAPFGSSLKALHPTCKGRFGRGIRRLSGPGSRMHDAQVRHARSRRWAFRRCPVPKRKKRRRGLTKPGHSAMRVLPRFLRMSRVGIPPDIGLTQADSRSRAGQQLDGEAHRWRAEPPGPSAGGHRAGLSRTTSQFQIGRPLHGCALE